MRLPPRTRWIVACAGFLASSALPAQSVTVRLDSATSARDTRVLAWLVSSDGRSVSAATIAGGDSHTLESRQPGAFALCARRPDGLVAGTRWFELREGERLQLDLLVHSDTASVSDRPHCQASVLPEGVIAIAARDDSLATPIRMLRVQVLDGGTYAPVRGAQLALRSDRAERAAGATGDSAGRAVIARLDLRSDAPLMASLRALGYRPRYMTLPASALRSADSLIVLLAPQPQQLSGVRVEGDQPLPTGIDRRTMGGWAVSDKVMNEVRLFARNFGDFIQWQSFAGVRVPSNDCVRIREAGCALIVVDGIPREPPLTIDPLMIEQIVILRPIDASTLYGMRGVDGAVLIRTSVGSGGRSR